ncbi:hypothetical protein LCGC14_1126020 [marine sediment metagenome]|uniref:Uncharacterized protein n=1 Tax=marine sediment metagenome TaxID=412755 RepID=A0A0F9M2M8_9ZZZZ|nr:hypothetical protein [Methylophaga sp.]
MKRTIITIKTINSGNKIKSQSRILLKEAEGWHGKIELVMKDGVCVHASAPVKNLTVEKISISAYLNNNDSGDGK